MLSKCSNPSCFNSFLHLKEGSLFRLEFDAQLRIPESTRVEYFWLCEGCSRAMTLRLGENGTVETLFPAISRLVDRREGWLLRNVKDPASDQLADFSETRLSDGLYGA